MSLTIEELVVGEGEFRLGPVSLELGEGEIIAILGASGSGKTTLLRAITGLGSVHSGAISFGGVNLVGVPPEARGIGMVFQRLGLFPHLDVAGNLGFGLEKSVRKDAAARERKISSVLSLVNLTGFENRAVDSLSGGEAQRVALARALLAKPRALLLDEPLASLDHELKLSLASELKRILKESNTPALYVTHDREEAGIIADRVIELSELVGE